MNIKVWDDKYTIKSDSHCYRVSEIKTKLDDEESAGDFSKSTDGTYEYTVGYVNTVADCFRLIVDREGRMNKCTTLNGYIKHIEAINKKLEENIRLFSNIVGGTQMIERAMKQFVSETGE